MYFLNRNIDDSNLNTPVRPGGARVADQDTVTNASLRVGGTVPRPEGARVTGQDTVANASLRVGGAVPRPEGARVADQDTVTNASLRVGGAVPRPEGARVADQETTVFTNLNTPIPSGGAAVATNQDIVGEELFADALRTGEGVQEVDERDDSLLALLNDDILFENNTPLPDIPVMAPGDEHNSSFFSNIQHHINTMKRFRSQLEDEEVRLNVVMRRMM